MKTPAEWVDYHLENYPSYSTPALKFIEAIQRDALPTNEKLELAHDVNENLEFQVELLTDSVEYFKDRWHEARRYLRQANKGAERNNMVMRLQAVDISRLLERIKQLEQRP